VQLVGADPVAAAAVASHGRPLVDGILRGRCAPNPAQGAPGASGAPEAGGLGAGQAGWEAGAPGSCRALARALEAARAAVEARLVAAGMWRLGVRRAPLAPRPKAPRGWRQGAAPQRVYETPLRV